MTGITTTTRDGIPTWQVEGAITMATAAKLFADYQATGGVCVDLAAVTETDSSAIALLLNWRRQALGAGNRFSILNLPESLASLAALYSVSDLLDKA